MKISLENIIDLDYLITLDDKLDSKEDIKSRELKDRKIYSEYQGSSKTDRDLLLSWLEFRKKEEGLPLMPGAFFSSLYISMVYIMVLSGFIAGITTVYSFLAYHGAKPVNVTSFIALFVVLQVVFVLLTTVVAIRRIAGKDNSFAGSIVHTFVSFLFFNVVFKILKKIGWGFLNQNIDTLEYISGFVRSKGREYQGLFFWSFFILTSLFAFSFSAGVLGGTFLKIVVSDMAFGWQSTLMTSSHNIHSIVSSIALPWSWFLPESIATPSLEQIEGSRIILKQGISVLTTENLTSWWPFLCFAILFYAVIPRGLIIVAGRFLQKLSLNSFNFANPKFRQLIVRMCTPVINIDTGEISENKDLAGKIDKIKLKAGSFTDNHNMVPGNMVSGKVLLLVSVDVYCKEAIQKIVKEIEQQLLFVIKKSVGVTFDPEEDTDIIHSLETSDTDQVILVHEVWQPPIRELISYIVKVKAALPQDLHLSVMLTNYADSEYLGVDRDDINLQVWKKTMLKLGDPGISVIRFLQP